MGWKTCLKHLTSFDKQHFYYANVRILPTQKYGTLRQDFELIRCKFGVQVGIYLAWTLCAIVVYPNICVFQESGRYWESRLKIAHKRSEPTVPAPRFHSPLRHALPVKQQVAKPPSIMIDFDLWAKFDQGLQILYIFICFRGPAYMPAILVWNPGNSMCLDPSQGVQQHWGPGKNAFSKQQSPAIKKPTNKNTSDEIYLISNLCEVDFIQIPDFQHCLVGGWATPLKHMKVSWDNEMPLFIWTN